MLARQAAAAVGVGTCWSWETAATRVAVCSAAQGASAPTGEERGGGARLQPVTSDNRSRYTSQHFVYLFVALSTNTFCRLSIDLCVCFRFKIMRLWGLTSVQNIIDHIRTIFIPFSSFDSVFIPCCSDEKRWTRN